MYVLYSLLTAVGMVLVSPYFLLRGLIYGKYLDNIPERFGWKFPPELRAEGSDRANEKSIWIHAVSVGEVLAVLPLAKELRQRYPRRRLIVSTTTATGQKLARERMGFANAVFYFPMDWPGPVRRALAVTQTAIVIIVETEIWPNFLRECRRAEVPVVFVNGRLSEKSYRGYLRALSLSGGLLRGFLKRVLSGATLFLMQSEQDAARLLSLGAPEPRVLVTGNLKYDLAEPPESPLSNWLAHELARNQRGPVLIAGSVMADEETAVLQAYTDVTREFPNALLILAPRKPDNFNSAAEIVTRAGHGLARRSEIALNGTRNSALAGSGSVFLLDSLGELAGLYRLADVVFVGGSLARNGGHNILEPAVFGKVPVYGPSMENFREMAANFLGAGAAIEVKNSRDLGAAWTGLLQDPDRAKRMGDSARRLADRNRGATNRVLSHVTELIDSSRGRI